LPATPPRAGARGGTAVLDEPLSVKEERILQLIAEDKSNKQIGAAVFLAEGTLKSYVSRVMDKLHARSRTELAVRALHRPGARA
jgi:DNA-binding NarL/FixJ family response regulator